MSGPDESKNSKLKMFHLFVTIPLVVTVVGGLAVEFVKSFAMEPRNIADNKGKEQRTIVQEPNKSNVSLPSQPEISQPKELSVVGEWEWRDGEEKDPFPHRLTFLDSGKLKASKFRGGKVASTIAFFDYRKTDNQTIEFSAKLLGDEYENTLAYKGGDFAGKVVSMKNDEITIEWSFVNPVNPRAYNSRSTEIYRRR